MAEDQQKKTPQSPTTSPSTLSPAQPPSKAPVASKPPTISRRAFLIGVVGASTVLTAAAFGQSALPPDFGILGPLVPAPEPPTVIAKAGDLESKYRAAVSAGTVDTGFNSTSTNFSEFFYWPYDISSSPYYKNIIVRLPDDKYLTGNPTSEQYLGQTYSSSPATSPTGGRFVAFNTTCVHLRCLVNPGYADGQFRLQCPCHGSQYNLADGVPVAGPAYDLGLQPLPKIQLSIDNSGNITATSLVGVPGVGRTSQ
jgi:Rieske Fe-S protein